MWASGNKKYKNYSEKKPTNKPLDGLKNIMDIAEESLVN